MDFKNNHDFLTLFEERLKQYTGAKYVILTDRCTNALFLILKYFELNELTQEKEIILPKKTYISVPQMITNFTNFNIKFKKIKWKESYQLGNLPIYDCAVGLKPDMYIKGTYQCLSFQQKKSLSIGKGGAILLDDYDAYITLSRMVHDGRDGSIPLSDDLDNITLGFHMNMSPDEASKGILLLNQLSSLTLGSFKNYPNISKVQY
jgi:dTDP-4-amino-4,6-dideoxygalactose transaminase